MDTERFLTAQQQDYTCALAEIKAGRKRSHWMWYIFPQLAGLGFSATSRHYALEDLDEAVAYLKHPVLGTRLREITSELLKHPENDAHAIFGSPDDLKLRSSMTLFALAEGGPECIFQQVLDKFYHGSHDLETTRLLGK